VSKREDDLETAESSYLAAAAIDTSNVEGWWLLGRFYMEHERAAEAVPLYERAVRLEPDNAAARYQLAKAQLVSGGDLEAAERGFREYIETDDRPDTPDLASAHWRLGMVYEVTGRYLDARSEWSTALNLDPEHERAAESMRLLREAHPELWAPGKAGEGAPGTP
jgi:cytochrome c-type biogenesis protein CcmH/NrfG